MVPATVLRFITTHVRGRRIVMVAGEIDITTAADLRTYLCDAVDANTGNASRVVIVNLSEVTFMDASGLTALVGAETHACERGAHLHLAALPAHITQLLHITGLDRHFEVCPTTSDDRLADGLRPEAARRRPGQPILIEAAEQEAAVLTDGRRLVSVIVGSGVG